MSKFREIASKKLWRILAFEVFQIDRQGNLLNLEEHLRRIKHSGLAIAIVLGRKMNFYTSIYSYKIFSVVYSLVKNNIF